MCITVITLKFVNIQNTEHCILHTILFLVIVLL